MPLGVRPCGTFTIIYDLRNIVIRVVSFILALLTSEDVSITGSDTLLASERWHSSLGLGSYGPGYLQRTVTIPNDVSLDTEYYIGVYADYSLEFEEVRKHNNKVALPGSIRTVADISSCQ